MSSSSFPSCSSSSKRKRDSTICFDDEGRYKRPKYDVFLNYSDEDTGKGFVSHLKGALSREGYSRFDRTMIQPGQDVLSELSKAIEESGMYLVILSKNYAASKQCLDELLSITDCLTRLPQKSRRVFPIFYNIEPSHVKSQKGRGFMEAFQAHESDIDVHPETCKKWKQALDDVAQKSGVDSLLNE